MKGSGARSRPTEFAVVLIEAVLLIGFAIPWAKRVNQFPADKDAIIVHAVGQQFNWNFHLPAGRRFRPARRSLVTTSNALGLDNSDPASKDDLVNGDAARPKDRPVIDFRPRT
jgi:heme/copper-type cytochrome/quinol oxidase subunit 2